VRTVLALLLIAASAVAGAAPRSPALRAEFQRTHPCPANGLTRGSCPAWQIDHIQPLCAGGRDEMDNLQWLRVDAHKEKTRRDVAACRGHLYRMRPDPEPAAV
jgi:hypothetical protein